MGFGKFLGCVVGGAVAIIAAPIVLPAMAAAGAAVAATAVGGAVAGATATVAGVAAAVGSAAASTVVGGAVIGAAATVGSAVAAVGTAAASTAVGAAVVGAATVAVETVGVSAIASSVVGAGLTYSGITSSEGFSNMKEGEEKIEVARNKYERSIKNLEQTQQKAVDRLSNLHNLKLDIYSNEIKKTINIIKRVKNVKETEVTTPNVEFIFEPNSIKEIEVTALKAEEVLKTSKDGLAMASTLSSLTAGLVSNFGVASTGTAISSLSGAAAKKATLAALGGGAKSIGGAGIAGGQIMLGGISLIPTAIILSNNYAKQSEEQLTKAIEYHSEVSKEVGKINNVITWIDNDMILRIQEIQDALVRIRTIHVKNVLPKLNNIELHRTKMDGKIYFNECSEEEKKCIVKAATIVSDLKEIIKAPLLDQNGVIRESTISLIKDYKTNENYV